MSLENVQAFYKRIADAQEFLAQLQATKTQEQGKKILAEAGYEFSTEELEEYTSQMLESTDGENNVLEEMNEEQLAAVVGGLSRIPIQPISIEPQPMYGIIWWPPKPWPPKPWPPIAQPMYGIPVDEPLVINNWETKEATQ